MSVITVHFNKQNANRGLPWTVHVKGKCIPASSVKIEVPVETVFKPDKKTNPRAWMRCSGAVWRNASDEGVTITQGEYQ